MNFLLALIFGAFITRAQDPTTSEPCDEFDLEANYAFEPVGKSTQFKIFDLCNDNWVKIKMASLTEYDGDDQKVNQKKVTTFASSGDWDKDGIFTTGTDQEEGFIYNRFQCNAIKQVDGAAVNVTTAFAVEEEEYQPQEVVGSTTGAPYMVPQGSVKLSVEIVWPFEADATDNTLQLCIDIQSNTGGDASVEDDGESVTLSNVDIDNSREATCFPSDGGDESTMEVTFEEPNGQDKEKQTCYNFDYCVGTIVYDPVYTLIPGGSPMFSVCAVFVAVAMSLLSV